MRPLCRDLSRTDGRARHARLLCEAPRPRRRLSLGAHRTGPRGHRGGRRAELGSPAAAGCRVLRAKPRRGRAVRTEPRAIPPAGGKPRRGRRPAPHELVHRRPGRPPHDPGPDARSPPHRRPRRERRRRSLPRIQDPGRCVRRASGSGSLDLRREHRRDSRRGRGVPDGDAAGAGARPRLGHRALHGHRRLD